jgi:hypothetical protein
MDSRIVAVFCLCDDMLKAMQHHEDQQCQMSDAEVMTTALIAALHFRGNFESARHLLHEQGYMPTMLSRSRFNRRLHRLSHLFLTLFNGLGETWKGLNANSVYVIDSFPIAACDNYRIPRSKRYRGEVWRGRQASKKRYFYGLKLHLMVTQHGQPVEFFFTPGSSSDTSALKQYDFDLPQDAWVIGDKAYTLTVASKMPSRKPVFTCCLCARRTLNDLCHLGSDTCKPAIAKPSRQLAAWWKGCCLNLFTPSPRKVSNSKWLSLYSLVASATFGSNLG